MDQNKKLDKTTVRFFYSMIQSAVLERPLQVETEIPDLEILFEYSKINSLAGLFYYSVFSNGLPVSDELRIRWKKELYETVYYNLSLKEYWKDLKKKLDQLDINYIPVKGAVIQNSYPKEGMRSMSDYDILYRYQQEEERGLRSRSLVQLKKLNAVEGIHVSADGGIVDTVSMGKQILFEMHREFLGSDQVGHDYYHTIWDRCNPTEHPHEFQLTDTDQFILMVVHSHKHYDFAGCGPKELIDYYVVKHDPKKNLDWNYIQQILARLNLVSYEQMLDRLTKIIFEDLPGTENDWDELEEWMCAGTYGNAQRAINNQLAKYTGDGRSLLKAKFLYLWRRLYPRKEFIKDQFPFFYAYPIFRPFIPIYRLIRSRNGISVKVKKELRLLLKQRSD